MAYRTITGYNAKWNHKKPHVHAIAAGSTIVFTAQRDAVVSGEFYVGMRQGEGFGRVLVVSLGGIENPIESPCTSPDFGSKEGDGSNAPSLLIGRRRLEDMRCAAIGFAETQRDARVFSPSRLNPAFVGRLTRMVEESNSMTELTVRIASVKTKVKQVDAQSLVDGLNSYLRNAGFASPRWGETKECLLLVLTLAKYYGKQCAGLNDMQTDGGSDD